MIPLVLVFMQGDSYGGLVSRFLKTRTMVWLGALTLDTYLLHQLMFAILLNNADKIGLHLPYLPMLALCVGLVVLLSWFVHSYFVAPVNRRLQSIIIDK
jgi:peptidoglycan/LPS O-acetylase OafA/YrhL